MINPKPLVITPQPQPLESLMGFILRTSEVNCYSSPTLILRYAGLTENEIRSVCPPIDKIAQLYARTPEEFSVFGNVQQQNKKSIKKWRILNHVIPALYTNIKSTRVCPECILENGFMDGMWEIRFSLVCAKHRRELIDSCPQCTKPLKWQRKGMLQCSCGYDLSEVRGVIIEDNSILNITDLIRWKLNNHHHDETRLIAAGYPLLDLKKVSLSTLLGIIERLQTKRKRITKFAEPLGNGNKLNVLKLASGMFEQWPNGFYDFLENLSTDNRHINSRSVQSQYLRIYNSFFKSGLPAVEVKFIRKAFVTFANVRLGKDVYIDTRLAKHAETSRRYVGIVGLAEHLKVQLPTIRNYVKKGLLITQIRECMGKTRIVFDLHTIPFKAREGNYYKQREAAKFINLSERILRSLKSKGVYKIKRLGWGTDGYSELDLIEFKESILQKAPEVIEYLPIEYMRLKEFFRKKSLGEDIVTNILDAILNGRLIPIGRTGNEITDIVINRQQLLNFT